MKIAYPLLVLALTFGGNAAIAQQGSLQTCQSIQDQIERYAALRRNGGSAKEMDSWKRKISELQTRQYDLNCRAWGSQIRD